VPDIAAKGLTAFHVNTKALFGVNEVALTDKELLISSVLT
jgi:hypothetical protein